MALISLLITDFLTQSIMWNTKQNFFVPMKFIVQAVWDAEAKVWVAQSENIPGLATEADTIRLV